MKETTKTLNIKVQAWELAREHREEQLNRKVRKDQSQKPWRKFEKAGKDVACKPCYLGAISSPAYSASIYGAQQRPRTLVILLRET